jgi:hypothetical protein
MRNSGLRQGLSDGSANPISLAILAAMLVFTAVWQLVLDPLLMDLVRSAYRMESIALLNDTMQGREAWPLEFYLNKASSLSAITLMCLIAYLLVVLMVLRPELYGKDIMKPEERRRIQAGLLILSLLGIGLAVGSGAQHDYTAYLEQWDLIVSGAQDPWGMHSSNAYGPAYNLFALPYLIHPLLPKLLFCFTWLCCSIYLVTLFIRQRNKGSAAWIAFVFIAMNPLFWVTTVIDGNFDIVVAAACLAGVAARSNRRDAVAAVLLALAVLLKYYPLAMVPFMMFDGRRLNRRFTLVFGISLVGGLLASIWIWGLSTFEPLLFATDRPSKYLSIFYFFRGEFSPLQFFMESPDLDGFSMPILLFGGGLVFALAWQRRLSVTPSAIVGMLTGLALYKVGHLQFLAVVVLLIWYWWGRDRIEYLANPGVSAAIGVYSVWIGAVSAAYLITAIYSGNEFGLGGRWEVIRDIIGLPTFMASAWTVVEIFRYHSRAAGVRKQFDRKASLPAIN